MMKILAVSDIHMAGHCLTQSGNPDVPEVNEYLEGAGISLPKQVRLISDQICLGGIGGGTPTPFSTPSDFFEEQLLEFVGTGYDQARNLLESPMALAKNKIPLILVSHTPAIGTRVGQLIDGTSAGSRAIRKFIEASLPDLCGCGHIHKAAGSDVIGCMMGSGGWLEIDIVN